MDKYTAAKAAGAVGFTGATSLALYKSHQYAYWPRVFKVMDENNQSIGLTLLHKKNDDNTISYVVDQPIVAVREDGNPQAEKVYTYSPDTEQLLLQDKSKYPNLKHSIEIKPFWWKKSLAKSEHLPGVVGHAFADKCYIKEV